MASPIQLTIYSADHEPVKELSVSLVPWGILKRAIKLAKSLKTDASKPSDMLDGLDEEGFDNLTGLVADLYHGKVTVDELQWGTDAGEMMAVLQSIVTRAFGEIGTGADPTQPGK